MIRLLYLLFLISFFSYPLFSQATEKTENTDALWQIYNDQAQADTIRLQAIEDMARHFLYIKTDSTYQLALLELELAHISKQPKWQGNALNTTGAALYIQGNYEQALEYFMDGLRIRESISDQTGMAGSLTNIGNIYEKQGDYTTALNYHIQSWKLYDGLKDKRGLSIALNNIGNIYKKQENYLEALKYYQGSLKIKQELGNKHSIATSLGNIGIIYVCLTDQDCRILNISPGEKLDIALSYYEKSLRLDMESGHDQGVAVSMSNIGDIYLREKNYPKAIAYAEQALEKAEKVGDMQTEKECWNVLYQARKAMGNTQLALDNYEKMIVLRDRIYREENLKEITRKKFQYEYEKKIAEDSIKFEAENKIKDLKISKQEAYLQQQRLALISVIGGALLILVLVYTIYTGKKRSDALLLNILPASTAAELKKNKRSEAKSYSHVTVLFTDFKGFTELSEQLSPAELVAELNECFTAFDQITEQYGLEKIKTIGDAYMAVAGLPETDPEHAVKAVRAAIAIRDFMLQRQPIFGGEGFQVRLGLNSGPVVAGIVGMKKFQYDIWGDTVNTAARMESNSEIGKINISAATYELVKMHFHCSYRGKISAKGKGEIEMYFVDGPRQS